MTWRSTWNLQRVKSFTCCVASLANILTSSSLQGPKPVFRRADIRRIPGGYPADIRRKSGGYPPSGGVLRMDFPWRRGRISLPIGWNREESGGGRGPVRPDLPSPLSSLFRPMGREMRPLSSVTSRKIHPEDSSGARISALRKTGFGGSCSSTKARAQNVHFSRCIQKSFMCSELYISLILCCPSTSPPTTTTPPHPVKILLLLPSLVYVFCGELFHFNWW